MKLTLILTSQNSARSVYTSPAGVLCHSDDYSRAIMAHHESRRQDIAVVAQCVGFRLQEQTSRTVTTTSVNLFDHASHMNVLRDQCQRVSSTIRNHPVACFGFERMIDAALSKVPSANVEAEPQDELAYLNELPKDAARQTSATHFHKKISNTTGSWYNSPFGNMFINTTTTRLISANEVDASLESDHLSYEIESKITFHPSQWLLACGINHGIQI